MQLACGRPAMPMRAPLTHRISLAGQRVAPIASYLLRQQLCSCSLVTGTNGDPSMVATVLRSRIRCVRVYFVVVDIRIVDCHMYPGEPCPPSHVLSYIPAEASMQYIHNIIRIYSSYIPLGCGGYDLKLSLFAIVA